MSPHSSSQVNIIFPGTKHARLRELSTNLGLQPFLDDACARSARSCYRSRTDRATARNTGGEIVIFFNMYDLNMQSMEGNLQQVAEPPYMSCTQLCTPWGGQLTYPTFMQYLRSWQVWIMVGFFKFLQLKCRICNDLILGSFNIELIRGLKSCISWFSRIVRRHS